MGCSLNKPARRKKPCRNAFVRALTEKIILLEEDMSEIARKRGKESEVHEQQVRTFEVKQSGWKYERKRLKEQIKKLKKESEEKDGRIQRLMENNNNTNYHQQQQQQHNIMVDEEKYHNGKEWQLTYHNYLMMEHMREEQLRREEAIEKWKRLYLAIKTQLDDLIDRTCRGERKYWRVEDEAIEELQREVNAKEETITVLKARLAATEEEGRKMKTEVDILRQSSRIMSHAKRTKNITKRTSRRLRL